MRLALTVRMLLFVVVCSLIPSHGHSDTFYQSCHSALVFHATVITDDGELPYYDVKSFGAKGDGQTVDSKAINDAITAAAMAGGGKVVFPAGVYLSGSIRLKSSVTIELQSGSILRAIFDATAYDLPEPFLGDQYQDEGHSHWHNGFLWGENLENVSIIGGGMIDGYGLSRNRGFDSLPPGLGDKAIALKNCRNVTLRGFTIKKGGHFGILATGVDLLQIENLTIDTNRDGINIDACRNVRITGCVINSPWDDAICLKSSYALGYARPTQNVMISDCYVSGFKEGTLLDGTYLRFDSLQYRSRPDGGIKMGTESNGGFKNISITNCVFEQCRGVSVESVDGGVVEDIAISNLTMKDLYDAPFFLRLGSRMRGPKNAEIGQMRRIAISNIVVDYADGFTGSVISGIPGHPIEDVSMSNITILYSGGGTTEYLKIIPPENETRFPRTEMFGKLPSYGFFIRHVKGFSMNQVNIRFAKDDHRSPFALTDVQNADFALIHAQKMPEAPAFLLKEVTGLMVRSYKGMKDTEIAEAKNKVL